MLGNALEGRRCRTYSPDLRIRVLREVMLVAHDERRVDLWRRTERAWTQRVFIEGEPVTLESLECALSVEEIYFDPLAPARD